MIVSYDVERFGDESAWRATFGGDLERFEGDIYINMIFDVFALKKINVKFLATPTNDGDGRRAASNAVDCLTLNFLKVFRIGRVNYDGCALKLIGFYNEKRIKKE